MIFAVIGTRPEVIKMAPVIKALRRRNIEVELIATGQHHDWRMMGSFLECFDLEVDHWLELKQRDLMGSFVEILGGLGDLCQQRHPEMVIAQGDTTTVVAAAFAARKSGSTFGHVEAGLRAFSRELPEEEHRICSDAMADLCFAPTRNSVENLTREHVNGKIILTGNTVLDALRSHPPKAVAPQDRDGILVTIHRQETVDHADKLRQVVAAIEILARTNHVEWPVHPRTLDKMREHGLEFPSNVVRSAPLGHKEFLDRLMRARLVITDSGGVQEESAILGIPCVTVRQHTERPETVEAGVGILAGLETDDILAAAREMLSDWEHYARPAAYLYGDGHAGEKIAVACQTFLAEQSYEKFAAGDQRQAVGK